MSFVASWRIGIWINAASTTLLFLLTCVLLWRVPGLDRAAAHLALLTAFVAMTTSWFGWRDVPALLAARSLGRQGVRIYHTANQGLIGGILFALLAGSVPLTWLALVIAVAASGVMLRVTRPASTTRSSRMRKWGSKDGYLLCGIGLMLALLGILLPEFRDIFLLVGFGALAGLVPLHVWLIDAAAEAPAPGAIIITALLPNVPVLLFLQLRVAPWLLIVFGLASLLGGAFGLFAQSDFRRSVALAGIAQLGMGVFAMGIGGAATRVGWLHMTLLALVRAGVLQSEDERPAQYAAVLALALLPLFVLFLLAAPTATASIWLLLAVGAGALLTSLPLIRRLPRPTSSLDSLVSAPVWLQLGLVALLAFAMPAPIVGWFHAVANGG